jgi:hypothetical protein
MDQQQDQHPPMQGDDELAKALQGGLQFEETPVGGDSKPDGQADAPSDAPSLSSTPDPLTVPPPDDKPADDKHADPDEPVIKHGHEKSSSNSSTGNADLDKIKSSALEELRPLVGKLNLPADEKFDTLLLIIRSTDDQALLDEAHTAAKAITDDAKRAQALLDIIKEIDYFSTKR